MKTIQVNEKLDFRGESIYAGIDVHKKQWNVSIMSTLKEHKTFVQPPDPIVLANYLKCNFPNASYYSVYEAGFSGFWIDEALRKEGIINIVVNPADVPTTDKEKKQKRDQVDSRKLCKALREKNLIGVYIPTQEHLEDRNAVRQRKKLVGDLVRCKNRIKGLINYYGIKVPVEYDVSYWPKAFIVWLNQVQLTQPSGTLTLQLWLEELQFIQKLKKKLDRHLVQLARQKYVTQVTLLRSIPGIGLIGALTILTELGDMKRFKRFDDLCSYVGLVPNVYSSGETEHVGHLTKRKPLHLQPILIQCTWKAVGKDPALLMAYQQWCKVMKANKAIVRVARKLLSRIRYVMINEKKYELKTM
jgi:transposase